jgi:type I restriction enzyme S subunit
MYFGSALCEQMIDHYDNGTAQPNLGSSSLAEFLIPLPPLAEQQRIVATVDRLMDECDTLDAQQDAAERVRVRCTEAATHALQTADTPTAVRTAWHRLRDHFDALCATPDDVDAVRQTILQLAVQGKLTEQDPSDEPADQLLERIQAEKQRLYDAGEIRKPKDMPSPTEDELPFTVPENWQWIRVTELMYDWGSGLERAKKEQSKDRQFPYVKMDNIDTMGNLALDSYTYVDADSEEIEKYKLHRGDFLFNVRNSTELVGKSCVFNVDSQVSFLFNNNILRVDFGTQVLSDYINSWFCSGAGRRMLDELKSSTTNVAAIYHKDFFTCVVPLPPLEEQQRIVATVDRLMDACDTLEAQLSRQQTLGAELLDAVLHDASTTGPEAVLAEA